MGKIQFKVHISYGCHNPHCSEYYLNRISNSKDTLLSEALSVSKLLYDQNKKSW
jgi:hypothetical protein